MNGTTSVRKAAGPSAGPRTRRAEGRARLVAVILAVALSLTVGACSLAGPTRGSGSGSEGQGAPAGAQAPAGEDRATEGEAPTGAAAGEDEARSTEEARDNAFSCAPSRGQEVLEFLNVLREDEGLGPLATDLRLVEAARRHARDLARSDLMGHEGSDGSTPAVRATRAGYPWTFVAENVAGGQGRAGEVVRGWMRSEGHRANIVDQRARHVGIGFIQQEGSQYRAYWVAVFGATEDSVVAVEGGCHP